jgi:hypothetical protein
MPSRSILVPVALAFAVSTGCAGGLSRNHQQGLAVVGGVAIVAGSTVLIDGMTCDEAYFQGATCTHDSGELRNGAIVTGAGVALLGWAVWQLAGGDDAAPASGERTAGIKPAPKPTK